MTFVKSSVLIFREESGTLLVVAKNVMCAASCQIRAPLRAYMRSVKDADESVGADETPLPEQVLMTPSRGLAEDGRNPQKVTEGVRR